MSKSPRIGTFISANLLDNPSASCSLTNLKFLLSQISQFDKRGVFLNLFNLWLFSFCVLSTLQTTRQHCFINRPKLLINQ